MYCWLPLPTPHNPLPESETLDGFVFVFVDLEDGDELRDVQQFVQFGGQMEQLELAAAIGRGRVRADELADA